MKEYLLIDLQYFGSVIYYATLIRFSNVDFALYEPFRKMSFRNRCILPGSNGLITLTVPVKGGRNQKLPMQEIRIDYRERWQEQHWRTIFSVYGKSPWFAWYAPELRQIFNYKPEWLADWNLHCHEWVSQKLGLEMQLTSRQSAGPDHFPAVEWEDKRDFLRPMDFQDSRHGSLPVYAQVFEDRIGFQPNMSILDLLCCEGKRSLEILERFETGLPGAGKAT
jgi:hypothetical protein